MERNEWTYWWVQLSAMLFTISSILCFVHFSIVAVIFGFLTLGIAIVLWVSLGITICVLEEEERNRRVK